MQVEFYLAGEITQVIDPIPWVRCASGNVFCCCYCWWLWCWWCWSLTGHDVCRPCHKQYGKTLLLLKAKTSKKNFPELLVLIMKMIIKMIMKVIMKMITIMILRRLVISMYGFYFLLFPIRRVIKFQQPESQKPRKNSQRTDVSLTTLIAGEMFWIWFSRKSSLWKENILWPSSNRLSCCC